jgi:hypothetical protein
MEKICICECVVVGVIIMITSWEEDNAKKEAHKKGSNGIE